MKLTSHFTLAEFTRSAKALKFDIDNTPTNDVINNLSMLCINVLEPARIKYGKPIRILSGFRCSALNTAVGGVKNSQHLCGLAADIPYNSSLWSILHFTDFDQLILEHKGKKQWIHVSWSCNCRRQVIKL